MPGPAYCRFATDFPAAVPSHSRKVTANSFVKKILPVSQLDRMICAEFFSIPMKTKSRGGGGRVHRAALSAPISKKSQPAQSALTIVAKFDKIEWFACTLRVPSGTTQRSKALGALKVSFQKLGKCKCTNSLASLPKSGRSCVHATVLSSGELPCTR